MIALVTLADAKLQLRRDDTADDVLVAQLILAASSIVLNHIKVEVPEEDSPDTRISQMFDQDTVPEDVSQAVMLVLADLYENREAGSANPLSSAVEAILCARRDPTLA